MRYSLDPFLIVFFLLLDWINCLIPNDVDFEQKRSLCEFEALRVGTRISDIFNARLSDSYDFDQSFYQQYLVENLGFDTNLIKGYNNSKMPSDSNILALKLRVDSGWEGFDDISDSNFWALKNQWIVFYGDKMLENIFQDYLTIFTDKNSQEYLDWKADMCKSQTHRRVINGDNIICSQSSLFGPNSIITYDYKDSIYDEYDEWFWGKYNIFKFSNKRKPEIIIFNIGEKFCTKGHKVFHDENNFEKLLRSLERYVKLIKFRLEQLKKNHFSSPTIIFVTSSTSFLPSSSSLKHCILNLNRLMTKYAHKNNFYVFEREEIERRFYDNSNVYDVSVYPLSEVVSTCLLSMLSCIKGGNLKTSEIWSGIPYV